MTSIKDYIQGRQRDALVAGGRLLGILMAVLHVRLAILILTAVYALRVMQRLNGVSFTREWLRKAMAEDSGHYVLYCLIIYTQPPSFLFLLPVLINSLLALVGFLNGMLRETGQPAVLSFVINFIAQRQQSLFGVICNFEVASLFVGALHLVTSFLSIRALPGFAGLVFFHALRYHSRRNNTNRVFWTQAVFTLNQLTQHRYCPALVARAYTFIKGRATLLSEKVKPE